MAQAVTSLTLHKPKSNPRPVNVGSVVDKEHKDSFLSEHFASAISIIPFQPYRKVNVLTALHLQYSTF
jgi:hypothetical protein